MEKGGHTLAVEVKSSKKIDSTMIGGLRYWKKNNSGRQGILIYGWERNEKLEEGIQVVGWKMIGDV